MIWRAIVIVALGAQIAVADVESDADRAFRAAGDRAAAGDPGAIGAFEQLGAARPVTRWTDDAWAEAARLAEAARDYPRARADLAQVIVLGTDDRLVARSRGALARIDAVTGGGAWDGVRAEHERLASVIYGGGDPDVALGALEALVDANPAYPRADAARLTIALGWEGEGETARALTWFRAAADHAATEQGQHARLEYVRALARAGELDDADAQLVALDPALADRMGAAQAADQVATARHRRHLRLALWAVLVMILGLAIAVQRRALASWGQVARRLARPPIEVWFLLPFGILLSLVAAGGNPLAARAVRWIGIAGVAIAWLSGAVLEALRVARPLGTRRMLLHVVVVVIAVATAAYLVVDTLGLLDLLGETWRGGPALP